MSIPFGEREEGCYQYIGTGKQNQKLVRNLVKNRHLIKDGRLIPGAAEKWKLIK